jgi:hypothetical protein
MLVSRGAQPTGGQTIVLQVGNNQKVFKTIVDLVEGINIIQHNLDLTPPLFPSELKVLDNATGAEILLRTVNESANSLTLYSIQPQKNVAISVVA